MINELKKKWEKVLSLILCMLIAVNCNSLHVYAVENKDNNATNDDPLIVVSMGDSYSSGEGIEPFYGQKKDESKAKDNNLSIEERIKDKDYSIEERVNNPAWLAHRSEFSWPGRLTIEGKQLKEYWVKLDINNRPIDFEEGKDAYWYFVASSGAVTDNLKKKQNKDYDREGQSGTERLAPQLDVFDQFEPNTVDYVTFTFGGNDVGFVDIITTAVTDNLKEAGINGFIEAIRFAVIKEAFSVPYININNLTDLLNSTKLDFVANGGIGDDIRRAYSDISNAAGENAKIIVAGYPTLIQSGNFSPFNEEQVNEINASVGWFNGEIEEIVDDCHKGGMKIYFAPVIGKGTEGIGFDGHEAYTDDAYINKVIPGTKKQDLKKLAITSAYSIHPNDDGAAAYARCVQKTIDEIEAGLEEDTEEPTDDGSEKSDIQKKIDEEIERQLERALEWLEKKLEEWLNQWLMKNCSC